MVSSFSRLVLVGLLSCVIAVQPDKKAADESTSKAFSTLKRFMNSRQEAATFKAQKRSNTREGLRKECCTTDGCYWEERREYVENYEWSLVDDTLYELSIAESSRRCRCRRRNKRDWFECGIGYGKPGDMANCRRADQWSCTDSPLRKDCISKTLTCDSNNDCGNWKDEHDKCQFDAASVVMLQKPAGGRPDNPPGSHYGNVMVGGRPVCDNDWDDNDAKVVCRDLGYPEEAVALAVKGSTFGEVTSNFMISNVACLGSENKLRDCKYLTRNDCGVADGAGAICIDPNKLKLVGGTENQRFGNVYIDSYPIGHTNWGYDEAQVVCNSLFVDQGGFTERQDSRVPVFKVTIDSEFGQANTDEIIMDQVNCIGNEHRLTNCQFVSHDMKTVGRSKVAGVRCAKCTPEDLLEIVALVNVGHTIPESKQIVDNAINQLKTRCYEWNCAERIPRYPEYCKLRAFLEEARKIVTADFRKQALLSLRFNPSELLKHQFTRELSNDLLRRLDALQEQTEEFQKELSRYFLTLANFDRDKARADYAYANGVWGAQRQSVSNIQTKLGPDLSKLFDFAFGAQGAEIVYRTAQLALAITSLASPVDAVFNPGEMAEKASTIYEKTAELADSAAEMKKLHFTFDETLPEFSRLASSLREKNKNNDVVYTEIAGILSINSMQDFTLEKANTFLSAYNDYTPPIGAHDLAKYKVLLEQIVENICEVINTPGGAIKAIIKVSAIKLCPRVKQNVEILTDLLNEMKDIQLEVMDTFADFARAKVSEMAARDLSEVMGRTFEDKIEGKIAGKRAGVLFQIHKALLINNACDYIKYTYYGEEQAFCATIRGNTFNDIANLIAFDYTTDRQCPDRYSRRGSFNIPAVARRGGEPLPNGTLDLTRLLDPSQRTGSMFFQIPNAKWLVDNGWIYSDEINQGPFFVKQIQLFPPPTLASIPSDLGTTFTLLDNTLGDELYLFDESVNAAFLLQEGNPVCNKQHILNSPYSVVNCQPQGDACIRSDGRLNGPIYPSLMARWKIDFAIPTSLKQALPFPVDQINLKVEAEICFRKSFAGKEVIERATPGSCCADSDKYTRANRECQSCPEGSSPRLNGYFCESCPSGSTPRDKGVASYGCVPCPVDTYKSTVGNLECLACNANEYTNGTTGSSLCAPRS